MESAEEFAKKTFDYIVVGGGLVGLALATLLARDTAVSVGVIEAGSKKDDETITIPGMVARRLGDPEYDWALKTTPQKNADNREMAIHRGKMLGGSGGLHFMIFTRGSRVEYDGWEKLGVKGWGWNAMRSAIDASEVWTPPTQSAAAHHADAVAESHGKDGYIKTFAFPEHSDLVHPYVSTLNELGIPTNKSDSSGNNIGVWSATGSIDPITKERSWSPNAYYEKVSHQTNITVLTGARAHRVLLSDGEGVDVRAIGVKYSVGGQKYTVNVSREVVLSAGALQTPQLLELSGIGNPKLLRELGIPVHVDLPGVGENFQEHYSLTVHGELKSADHISPEALFNPEFAKAELDKYHKTKTGMFSTLFGTFCFASARQFIPEATFTRLLASLDEALQAPEIQSSPYKPWYDLQREFLVRDEIGQIEIAFSPAWMHEGCKKEKSRHFTMALFIQRPWSRGYVHAKSANIEDPPEIEPNTLTSPADIDTIILVEAIKFAMKIASTGKFGDLVEEFLVPSPTSTDEQLVEYVKKTVRCALHPAGSAAMLPRGAQGVLDDELKVYGTSNLRVADASMFPTALGTHPQATLYGLAHRAADFITGR